jgi:hypothetical protein
MSACSQRLAFASRTSSGWAPRTAHGGPRQGRACVRYPTARLSPVPGSDRAMPTGPTISPAISAAGRVLIPGRQTPGPREGAGGIASIKRQVSDHEWVLLADDGLRQRAPGSQRAARGRGERRQAEARNSAELLILNASYRPVDGFQDPRQARQGAGLAVSSAPGQGPQAQRGMPRLLSAVHPRGFTIGNRPSARSRAVSAVVRLVSRPGSHRQTI